MSLEDRRIEYLEIVQSKNEAVNVLLENVKKITDGLPSDVQALALAKPELIIQTIDALGATIDMYQREVLELTEKWLEMMDKCEKLADSVIAARKKHGL